MTKKENGSAIVVVLLILVLGVGMGAAFLSPTDKPEEMTEGYTQREADLLCENTQKDACEALWFYRSNNPESWDKILKNLEGESIDPTIHRREYIDKVNNLVDTANSLLADVERDAATLKKGDQKKAEKLLQQTTRAIRALATVMGIAGEADDQWTEAVDYAFKISRSLRAYLPDDVPNVTKRDFVLKKIANRSTNRPLFRPSWYAYFGRLLPKAGRVVKIIVRDNDDGDENKTQDRDNKVFLYVTALLPDGTLAQTESLVEYAPEKQKNSVLVLQNRKLQ